MRVVGIDPGTVLLGYGVIERARTRFHYIECGVLRPPPQQDVASRIAAIAFELDDLLREFSPAVLVLEKAYCGKNAASALKLGQVRGAVMLLAAQHGLATYEYAPSTIKESVTGHGRATKAQIQDRMQMIFGLARTPTADAADALAIALCHASRAPVGGSESRS